MQRWQKKTLKLQVEGSLLHRWERYMNFKNTTSGRNYILCKNNNHYRITGDKF